MTVHLIGKKKRTKNTSSISPKFNFLQFCPVLLNSAQFYPVLPSFHQFCWVFLPISSSFTQFSSVFFSFPSFSQFYPVSPRLFQPFNFTAISSPLFCPTLCCGSCTCPYHSSIAHFYKFIFMTRCSFSIQRCNHFKRCHHAANPTITRDPLCVPVFEFISKNENNIPMLNQHTIAPVTKSITSTPLLNRTLQGTTRNLYRYFLYWRVLVHIDKI